MFFLWAVWPPVKVVPQDQSVVSKADMHKAIVPASVGCEQALDFEASASEVEAKQCLVYGPC